MNEKTDIIICLQFVTMFPSILKFMLFGVLVLGLILGKYWDIGLVYCGF